MQIRGRDGPPRGVPSPLCEGDGGVLKLTDKPNFFAIMQSANHENHAKGDTAYDE